MHPDLILSLASKVKSGHRHPREFVRTFAELLDRNKIHESVSLCPPFLVQELERYIREFDCDSPGFADSWPIYNLSFFPGLSTEETMRLREEAAIEARGNVKALHDYFKNQPRRI